MKLYREADPTRDDLRLATTLWVVPVEPCNQCGGPIVTIRGQVPQMPDRTVCPTCLVETIESLVTSVPFVDAVYGIGGDE